MTVVNENVCVKRNIKINWANNKLVLVSGHVHQFFNIYDNYQPQHTGSEIWLG